MGYNNNVYRSLILLSQFTINMLVPIFLCSFGGYWLDKKLHTSFLVVVFFFIGALAGGRNVYHMARKVYDDKNTRPSEGYASNRKGQEKKRAVRDENK